MDDRQLYDVVIVGAGSAGAAAAALCAERGLATLCIDRKPLDQAGACWVNGVQEQAFHDAGIDLPQGDELVGRGGLFHLVAGRGQTRVETENPDHLELDMRRLVARLQDQARRAGAQLWGQTRVLRVRDVQGRDCARAPERRDLGQDHGDWLVLSLTRGREVRTRFAVDASGFAGARLLGQSPVPGRHLCAAAQANFQVRDQAKARSFFARNRAELGQTLCFTSVAGGYSIINVRCDDEHASVLTGSIPSRGVPPGKELLDQFVFENRAWIGERVFGGARAIPLRRPRDLIAHGRIALIGDAACQVFSAHGSGTGPGLVAARILADALAAGEGPQGYAVTWQRRHGGLLAASDLFRRFSQTLEVPQLEAMIQAGLIGPETVRAGMAQTLPRLRPKERLRSTNLSELRFRGPWLRTGRKLALLAREARLGARLAQTAGRMAFAYTLYQRYPERTADLGPWARKVARLFGDPPDING